MAGAIRAVLFDKDGTLFDFASIWTPAYRAAAQSYAEALGRPGLADALLLGAGYDPATDAYTPGSVLISGDADEICAAFEAVTGATRPDLVAPTEAVMDHWSALPREPICDLDVLFRDLKRRGLALGIATMDSEAALAAILKGAPWRRHLDFTCGYDSGHGTKPGPGMVQAFAAAIAIPSREIAVIGDSPHDIAMARSAGAGLAVAVRTGPTPEEDLTSSDVIVDNIVEARDWMATLAGPGTNKRSKSL